MKFWLISRTSHEAMTGLLTRQVTSLEEERKILLDRLATLGLGGPLFSVPVVEQPAGTESEDEPVVDELEQIMSLRKRRPTKFVEAMADYMARQNRKIPGTTVAWVPDANRVTAKLDEIEEQAKQA